LVSPEQALLQKPTGNNKLAADSAANVPPLLVLTAAECSSQFEFCLSSRAACLTNLNPQNLPILALGGGVILCAPYVIVCGSYICTFPFI
jgi:hypothetical protein